MIKESRLNFIFILVVAFASYMAFNQKPINIDGGTPYSCNTEDITDMYEDYIQRWKQEVNIAFNEAEEEVIDTDTPDIVGPHPDPDKCICGGSGWIEQGDGHKTKCPYHGTGMGEIIEKNGLILHRN